MAKRTLSTTKDRAISLHQNVPPDWYARSIRENILQRYWHTKRFTEIGKLLPKTAGKILDIGSADGTFTKVVLDKTSADKIIGIDVLARSIAYAKRRFARSKRLSFRVADAHNLPFPNRSFDAVFCLETLEHVENPEQVISEIHRVLKDDGYTIILVPSENFLFHWVVWPLWSLYRGGIWKGTHLHELPMKELLQKITKSGFKIQEKISFNLGMLHAIRVVKNNK